MLEAEGDDDASVDDAPRVDLRRTDGRATILRASTRCMVRRGYHATSIRDIATEAKMTSAALYHHFPSKQQILVAIMDRALDEATQAVEQAIHDVPAKPSSRLRAAAEAWVDFHATHRDEALIGATELRSLEDGTRDAVIARRDAIEATFRALVQQGIDAGDFNSQPSASTCARAIIGMGVNVSTWFDPDGAMSPSDLASHYAEMATRLVGGSGSR